MGWLLYVLTTSTPFVIEAGTINFTGIFATFGAAFLIGAIFSHNKQTAERERALTMKATSAGIAHELRTPFTSISLGAEVLQDMLPELADTYNLAREKKWITPNIRPGRLERARDIPKNILTEAKSVLMVIDLLLANARHTQIVQPDTEFSVTSTLETALERYPFKSEQRALVHWEKGPDFMLRGDPEFLYFVLFNMLRNALYFVAKAGKGDIAIRLGEDAENHYLYFKDTGTGISPHDLSHIFDQFFTKNTHHGSGIGLSFCKMVCESFGGGIHCESVEGDYTLFILTFPKDR